MPYPVAPIGTSIVVARTLLNAEEPRAGAAIARQEMEPSDDEFVSIENALTPMLVTLLGMIMLVRLLQKANVCSPMLVTLLPMLTLVRLVQLENELSPVLVTLLPMVALVSPRQLKNARKSMLVI